MSCFVLVLFCLLVFSFVLFVCLFVFGSDAHSCHVPPHEPPSPLGDVFREGSFGGEVGRRIRTGPIGGSAVVVVVVVAHRAQVRIKPD